MKLDELGSLLSRRRKGLKISKQELAELCGVSVHAICNLERGAGNPTFDVLSSVAETLGLELGLSPKVLEGA